MGKQKRHKITPVPFSFTSCFALEMALPYYPLLRRTHYKWVNSSVRDYKSRTASLPNIPPSWEVAITSTDTLQHVQMMEELDEEEKTLLRKLIETFVAKKRFKDYVQKNIAAL